MWEAFAWEFAHGISQSAQEVLKRRAVASGKGQGGGQAQKRMLLELMTCPTG